MKILSSLSSGEEKPEKTGIKCFIAVGVETAILGKSQPEPPPFSCRNGRIKKNRGKYHLLEEHWLLGTTERSRVVQVACEQ